MIEKIAVLYMHLEFDSIINPVISMVQIHTRNYLMHFFCILQTVSGDIIDVTAFSMQNNRKQSKIALNLLLI